jgi:hypothetical protein
VINVLTRFHATVSFNVFQLKGGSLDGTMHVRNKSPYESFD